MSGWCDNRHGKCLALCLPICSNRSTNRVVSILVNVIAVIRDSLSLLGVSSCLLLNRFPVLSGASSLFRVFFVTPRGICFLFWRAVFVGQEVQNCFFLKTFLRFLICYIPGITFDSALCCLGVLSVMAFFFTSSCILLVLDLLFLISQGCRNIP